MSVYLNRYLTHMCNNIVFNDYASAWLQLYSRNNNNI